MVECVFLSLGAGLLVNPLAVKLMRRIANLTLGRYSLSCVQSEAGVLTADASEAITKMLDELYELESARRLDGTCSRCVLGLPALQALRRQR